MEKMSFKTFVWPRNPHTYKEEYLRQPHYRTVDGKVYYVEMGDMQRVITVSGTFFGEYAYEDFRSLVELFEEAEAGNLEHPLWGIRYCYFTGMELTQEPRQDCISYQLTFTGASTNGQIPK